MIALSLVAALSACAARQEKATAAQAAPALALPSLAKVPEPMANFARLISGEWRQTASSGTSMYHTWHWGPGQHSIRRRTDGSGALGQPWHELQVYYWHPGRRQIRVLGMSPYARGINEGTIGFDGRSAEGVSDLYQSGGIHRQMGLRWLFNGEDQYRETLLEATDSAGLEPLVEFDHVRSKAAAVTRPRTVEGARPSEHLKALEPLLGHVWETKGARTDDVAIRTRATFEWVPVADAIYARVIASTTGGEPSHWLDAYIYHHTGAKRLRCLALSHSGGVHEGDISVVEGGALQLDLKGYDGDRVVVSVLRFDFERDGTLRARGWTLHGTARTLAFDHHHEKVEPQHE